MQKMEKPILLLARITSALLSTVMSSRPVICVFAAALRVNTQTVETQMPCRFCRIMCELGFKVLWCKLLLVTSLHYRFFKFIETVLFDLQRRHI